MQRRGSTPGNERAEGAPSCPPRWHPPQLPFVKQHKPIGANGRRGSTHGKPSRTVKAVPNRAAIHTVA